MGQRLAVREPTRRGIQVESLPTSTLLETPSAAHSAELHWRYAMPLLTLIGTALAIGLARVKPRQGRFARIVPGIMVFVGYYLLLVMTQNALRSGIWPLSVGLWPLHGVFVVVALMLIHHVARPAKA